MTESLNGDITPSTSSFPSWVKGPATSAKVPPSSIIHFGRDTRSVVAMNATGSQRLPGSEGQYTICLLGRGGSMPSPIV